MRPLDSNQSVCHQRPGSAPQLKSNGASPLMPRRVTGHCGASVRLMESDHDEDHQRLRRPMGTSSQSRALFQPRFTDAARGLFYYYSSLTGADWTTVTAVSLPRNHARSSRRLSSPYVQAWLRQLITQSRPGFAGKEVSSPAQEAHSLIAEGATPSPTHPC